MVLSGVVFGAGERFEERSRREGLKVRRRGQEWCGTWW